MTLGQSSANKQEQDFKLTLAGKEKEIYDLKVQLNKKDKLYQDSIAEI